MALIDDIDPHKNWLSSSDSALKYAFGTTRPKITAFPHCIFPASAASLRVVAEVVDNPIGVWGNSKPLVDACGRTYLEPPDSRIIADFKLWALPRNQDHAIEQGGRLPGFIAVISADISEAMLTRMYDANIGEDQFDYYQCIRLLPDWIDILGWVYIPLQYEAEYAMFVAAARNRTLIDQMKGRLTTGGIKPIFEVMSIKGQQKWTGPLYPCKD